MQTKKFIKQVLKFSGQAMLVVIVLVFICVVYLRLTVEPLPAHEYFSDNRFLVLAHRGGRGLWPENTLYAFREAAAIGVDVLDFDVHGLPDGNIVVMHDQDVARTTNAAGDIGSYTLEALKQLDAGFNWSADGGQTFPYRGKGITVPTLTEVLAEFSHLRMNIEIKSGPADITARFCNSLREHDMLDRVVVASFSADIMRRFRRDCPGVATAAGVAEAAPFYLLNMVYLAGIWHPPVETMQMPGFRNGKPLLNSRFVNSAHRHNIRVYAWTINDPAEMQSMLELGVDGIITDYPDRLLALPQSRNGE